MIAIEWIVFLIIAIPFGIWAAWSDLKFMRIPNILSILLVATFVIVGIFLLPLDEYLIRLAAMVLAVFVGFAIYYSGAVGGGDVKLIAAMIPFIRPNDLMIFFVFIAMMSLAGVLAHRMIGAAGLAPAGWVSWGKTRKFPFGFCLAGAFIFYFVYKIVMAIVLSETMS